MTDADQWIVIRNWDRFQHYKDRWSPEWIKFYPSLLHDPNFTELSEGARLVLCQLFLVYASARAQVPLSTRWLSRQLSMRVTSAQLESLNHAGFIEFHSRPVLEHVYMASSPRALAREELEVEEKEKGTSTSTTGPADGSATPNGATPPAATPRRTLLENLRHFITTTGYQYTDNSLADEIHDQERKRGETISPEEKRALLVLAAERRKQEPT